MECDVFYEDSTSFAGICYLVDFIDTAHTAQGSIKKSFLSFSNENNRAKLILNTSHHG